jgi:large repetitive protein
VIQAEACDMQDGFVIMNQGTGGTAPYSYNIGNGYQPNNPNFINLEAGNYTVMIRDFNNCVSSIPVTVPFLPAPTLAVPSKTNETCGLVNGSFTASVTMGGTPVFQYSITSGSSQTNPTFSSLPAGNFVVTVTDANGCTDTESVNLINIPGPSQLNVVNVTPEYCGQENGTVTVSPVGGTQPYSYNIGFGQESAPNFANLPAGSYTATVTDLNNCLAFANVVVPASNGATLSVASSSNANCGQASGWVTISATNGGTPYLYNIGNGNQSSSSFFNLLAGSYTVSVTDANNCITTLPFTINDIGGPSPSINSLTISNGFGHRWRKSIYVQHREWK